jgi:hypothetical protein
MRFVANRGGKMIVANLSKTTDGAEGGRAEPADNEHPPLKTTQRGTLLVSLFQSDPVDRMTLPRVLSSRRSR